MIKRTREIVEADMPVKLEALKSHLRIADDAFDADLLLKLHTATQWAESQIGRTLNTYNCSYANLDAKAEESITIPLDKRELQSINDVNCKYDVTDEGIILYPEGAANVEVSYTIGCAIELAYPIAAAILLRAASLFANPNDSVQYKLTASENLLRPYRNYGLQKL